MEALGDGEQLLALQADQAEHLADLSGLDAIADALDDDARRAQATLRRMTMHMNGGEYRKAETVGRQTLVFAERAGSTILAACVWPPGPGRSEVGQIPGSTANSPSKGLRWRPFNGDRATEADSLNSLGTILCEQGDLVGGDALTSRALTICRENEDRVREADLLNRLGDNHIRQESTSQRRTPSARLRLARQLGWTFTESIVRVDLAAIAHLQGRHDRTIPDAGRSAERDPERRP